MSGASKSRKYRAQHEASLRRTAEEIRIQKAYVSFYDQFNSGSPSIASRGNNNIMQPYQNYESAGRGAGRGAVGAPTNTFSWVTPDSYRTRISTNQGTTNISTFGMNAASYKAIADMLRPKAINAQLSGIASAEQSRAQLLKSGAKKPGSKRGMGGTGSSPAKNAAGFYISTGSSKSSAGVTGLSSSNQSKIKNVSNQSYKDQKAYGDARQAATTQEGKAAIDAKWSSDIQSSYLSQFGLTRSSETGIKPLVKNSQSDWSSSTMQYLGVLPEGKKYSSETQKLTAKQQKMLDDDPSSGLVAFGMDGRVSAAPMSGKIDWNQFDGMTPEKIKQVKGDISDIMIKRDIGSQLVEQISAEKTISDKIAALQVDIDLSKKTSNVSDADKQKTLDAIYRRSGGTTDKSVKDKIADNAFNIYGNYANADYLAMKTDSESQQSKRKINKQENELNLLKLEQKSIHKGRTILGNAISSVGRNELFQKLYDSGTFDAGTTEMFLTINTDQDRDRSINNMQSMSQKQGIIESSISTLSKLETKLRRLKRIKSKVGTSDWNKQRDAVYDEIRSVVTGFTINNDMKVADVKTKLAKVSNKYSSEFKDIKIKKNALALKIAKNSTDTQRQELASSTNQTATTKKQIAEMTGWDKQAIDSSTSDEVMSAWDKTWIGGGAKNLMRGAESIDIMTGGKIDQATKNEFSAKASVVKRFDGWASAGSYIGESISAYKDNMKKTYKKSHQSGTVSDATISKSWFGKSTVEGESFTLGAASEIGVREGMGAREDVGKIVTRSEKYRSTIVDEIDTKKQELILLREKQKQLQSSHKDLLPLIDQQVEKDYDAGGKQLDQSLVEKLNKSSQEMYDLNYKIAEHQVSQEFYEKSLTKTDSDLEKYKQYKKQLDFETVQGTSSSGMINRIKRSGSYGRNQVNRFRRNTGVRRNTTRGGVRRQSLGGLVT